MADRFGELQPHWLDDVIESSWRQHDANEIASAITHNKKLILAIRQGLEDARQLPQQQVGLSQAQCIRQAVLGAMQI
jgi:hypothetical protein